MHCELTIDLLPICFQIMEESLRKFAAENFSHRYFPALHGEIDKVQPLTMVVQKNRPLWKRPFVKLEVIVLAELAKYVKSEEDTKVFRNYTERKIKEEMLISSPHETIAMGSRYDHSLTQFFRAWHINVLHLNKVCLIQKNKKKYWQEHHESQPQFFVISPGFLTAFKTVFTGRRVEASEVKLPVPCCFLTFTGGFSKVHSSNAFSHSSYNEDNTWSLFR